MHRMALIAASVVLITGAADAAEKFQRLSGDQIRARLSGMAMTDDAHWRDTYERMAP